MISQEEQQAIDAYLKAEKVNVIPRGTTGEPIYKWFPRGTRFEDSGDLLEVNEHGEPMTQAEIQDRLRRRRWANRSSFLVTSRRSKVRGLSKDMTVSEIADHLGLKSDIVRNDLSKMRLKAKPAVRTSKQVRDIVIEAVKGGCKTWQEVVAETGVSRRSAARYLDASCG